MKKFVYIFGCFLFVFFSIFLVNSVKKEETSSSNLSGYAFVNTNNCYFYRFLTTEENLNNKYFLLEKTYFVRVIENANEEFYKAEYNGIKGYVKKTDIEFVEEIPENPFLVGITFDIYSASSVELRLEPSTKSGIGSVLMSIPAGQKNLSYIGKIAGEESMDGLGNIWYYASYTLPNGKEICGYIYSPLTRNLSPISENNENLTVVSVSQYVPVSSLLYLNLSTKNMIILIISIPAIVVLYLFVKPSKILKE